MRQAMPNYVFTETKTGLQLRKTYLNYHFHKDKIGNVLALACNSDVC